MDYKNIFESLYLPIKAATLEDMVKQAPTFRDEFLKNWGTRF